MKYTIEQLIALLGLPMSDEKAINALESYEMEMPVIDEQFYFEKIVSSYNKDETLSIVFEESNTNLKSADLVIVAINLYEGFEGAYPFNLLPNDSYIEISKKLGKKANFKDPDLKKFKCWILENKSVYLSIGFQTKDLIGIKYIQITGYDPNASDPTLVPNEE